DVALYRDRARVGTVDAREDLEQGALARAVVSDDARELAGRHLEADVAESIQSPVPRGAPPMGEPVLEGRAVVERDAELLGEALHLDGEAGGGRGHRFWAKFRARARKVSDPTVSTRSTSRNGTGSSQGAFRGAHWFTAAR